jgi:hypothetical protein
MKTIMLDIATTIQLGNAARSYAEQLRRDAALYRSQNASLAIDAEEMADKLETLAADIDCGPINIIGLS